MAESLLIAQALFCIGLWAMVRCATLLPRGMRMKNLITRFVRDEQGQDLIEYGLLIGIITAGSLAFINPIGSKVSGYFNNLNNNLP